MKHQISSILCFLSIVGMLFAFASCDYSKEDIDTIKEACYEDGRAEGYEEGYDDGFIDGLYKGLSDGKEKYSSSNAEFFFIEMLDDAKSYANDVSGDMRFWEAMDIVSVYLDGYDPDGYPLPTKQEFEEAVDVIFSYAMYLEYNAMELE